jgi:hypothetical protein
MADAMVARPDYQQFVDTATGDTEPKGAQLRQFQAVVQSLAEGCSG